MEITEFLISKGADLLAKSNENRSLLHTAAGHQSLSIIKFLVESKSAGDIPFFKPVENGGIIFFRADKFNDHLRHPYHKET